jgi:type IV pilus assembly protein PilY1
MKKLLLAMATSTALSPLFSFADDIEIYINPAQGGGAPYVHMMLDYRPSVFSPICTYDTDCAPPFMTPEAYANLGLRAAGEKITRYEAFVAILTTLFLNPEFEEIYMSLVVSNFDTNQNPKQHGGTILEGYKQLKTGAAELVATLRSMPIPKSNNSVHKLQPKHTYYEWYRYLNGGAVINGADTAQNFAADPASPAHDRDIMDVSETDYISPFKDPAACNKLFSVMLAMNAANESNDLDSTIEGDLTFGKGTAAKFEDMMQHMHRPGTDLVDDAILAGNQPLAKSWVISDSGSIGATQDWAKAGGSTILDIDDPAELEKSLTNAFKEIVSVSSTFVAASVPVNVFNRAESLDNLFIALFEAQSTLRWPGNIKKLKLVDTDDDGNFDDIQDVKGNPGFETTGDDRGRITFDAVTYWTDVNALPPGNAEEGVPIGADGREVARGGAGQKIPGFIDDGTHVIGDANSDSDSRQVYVEPAAVVNGSNNALVDFSVTDAVADALIADLGAADRAEALELIAWGRGQDVDDEDGDKDRREARTWILGDAIHSRPFALNYGALGAYTQDNPLIRLFMGTNDGLFHIVENTDSAGNETGAEVAAFYPRAVLENLKYRREDTQASALMRYGVDGAPVVFTQDLNKDGTLNASDGDRAYVYFGLRRGGYSYYALDVSNPNIAPKIRWKIEQTIGGDFDELGLTFSDPVVGKVKYGTSSVDALIFAGGYNGGWDATYTNRVGKDDNDGDDTVGNAIYIVNARTGGLIWKAVFGATGTSSNTHYEHAEMVDSIPSGVTVLKNSAGNIHRLYVGDTGGAVWRVDLPEGSGTNFRKDNWFVTKLAELGTDGASTDRRFFHAPDVVETFDATGDFDGVLISSGDRAHPLETSVNNYLFYIKDRLIASGDPAVKLRAPFTVANASLPDQTACVTGSEGGASCASDADLASGWKIALARNGEKGLASPLVDGGRVFFPSFVPAGARVACEPVEGQSYIYLVNLADGTAVANNLRIYDVGPGIASSAIVVGDAILVPGGGIEIMDEDGDGDLDLQKLTPSLSKRLFQIYWREPGIDKL